MAIVKRVGVVSFGKVLGVLYALLGLIVGGLLSLLSLAGAFAAQNRGQGVGALMFGAGAIIIVPIFYGLIGFIGGIIVAALYNVVASIAGGIELELDQTTPPSAFPVTGQGWQR